MVYWDCDFFFFQAEDGIRDSSVTGVQTCALPISCSSPNSKWNHNDFRLGKIGANIWNQPGNFYGTLPGSDCAQARGGASTDYGKAGIWHCLADSWIYFTQKPHDPIFIRVPIHRAHKD